MAESFQTIYRRACERKGGERVLEAMLRAPLTKANVEKISDDRFLAAMTKQVFKSGFVWRVIEQKWPDFETVFFGFDVDKRKQDFRTWKSQVLDLIQNGKDFDQMDKIEREVFELKE